MTTRNESATTQEKNKQTTSRSGDTQQTQHTSGDGRDRERQLQTGRENGQTGMVRSQGSRGLGSVARSPFAVMSRMMEDMDRMFERFGFGRDLTPAFGGFDRDLWSGLSDTATALWSPAVEVFEKGDTLVVRAELPGVSKDDVSVDIADDVLRIEGERRQESEDRGEGFYRSERSYGRFMRAIPLPEGVDGDNADARFQDGVLEITLPAPKRERKRSRRLSIR